jgi:hypothetical protein
MRVLVRAECYADPSTSYLLWFPKAAAATGDYKKLVTGHLKLSYASCLVLDELRFRVVSMLPEALGLVSAVEVTASTAEERARWCRLLHLHQMLRQRAILDVRLPGGPG